MPAPIAILTDFGLQDPYVGIMKGVIASLAPGTAMIDLSHQVPPGDVRRAAFMLWQSAPHFPPGTVFLAVIDPGVGTERRGLVVQAHGRSFVGPDNGLFTYLLTGEWRAWELRRQRWWWQGESATFHGRDVFAPAAAHIARGVNPDAFGPPVADPVRFALPRLEWTAEGDLLGEVLHADRFGNLITSLGQFLPESGRWRWRAWLPTATERQGDGQPGAVLLPNGHLLRLVRTFADLEEGATGALVGSTGLIELVANRASAAEMLNLFPGTPLRLKPSDQSEV